MVRGVVRGGTEIEYVRILLFFSRDLATTIIFHVVDMDLRSEMRWVHKAERDALSEVVVSVPLEVLPCMDRSKSRGELWCCTCFDVALGVVF